MRTTTYTIHDLTKRIEKQQKALEAIATQLANYSNEHKGIWVYPSAAADERQYRADQREQLQERRDKLFRRIGEAQERYAARQRQPENQPDESGDANSTDEGTAQPSPPSE
jgi:peptidoglycan hydrolase CwlO-like protein